MLPKRNSKRYRWSFDEKKNLLFAYEYETHTLKDNFLLFGKCINSKLELNLNYVNQILTFVDRESIYYNIINDFYPFYGDTFKDGHCYLLNIGQVKISNEGMESYENWSECWTGKLLKVIDNFTINPYPE